MLRMQRDELRSIAEFKVGIIEAGCNGATHERPLTAADESATLPDAGRNDELRLVTGGQVVADDYNPRAAVGPKLEHLDGVAGIEVEHLVALDDMYRREGIRCEQIIDGGRDVAIAIV